MPNKPLLSIVSPVYHAENIIDELVQRIEQAVLPITPLFEIILVEDGSPDNSWSKITQNSLRSSYVKGLKLSRNFGQHAAITAGLAQASGTWIVVMDCDLQDRPEEIVALYQKALQGYDLVFAQRTERQDGFLKKASSKLFYNLFSYLTNTKQDSSVANFGIYHQKVIHAILQLGDRVRYFPTMSQWVGFRKTYHAVSHDKRFEGKTSYSWRKLINLAFDNMISFSDKPLRVTIQAGLFIAAIAALMGCYYLYLYLSGRIEVLGFASIVISLWFLSGLIIFILGIIGSYLGKVFEQVKNRPVYIIDQIVQQP